MAVIIGMDPHKRSATIEVVDERARVSRPGVSGESSLEGSLSWHVPRSTPLSCGSARFAW
jgi:hypothetical protein